MSRTVCFIDDDGQVGTCINEDDGNCNECPHNDDAHKKWVAECNEKEEEEESHLLKSIRTHEFDISVDFIVDDIIITGWTSTEGIQVSAITRCFDDDKHCMDGNDDFDCTKCPYTDMEKQEAIFKKYEDTVVEILRDAYKKIEALRVKK
jgi:hypothetical protein